MPEDGSEKRCSGRAGAHQELSPLHGADSLSQGGTQGTGREQDRGNRKSSQVRQVQQAQFWMLLWSSSSPERCTSPKVIVRRPCRLNHGTPLWPLINAASWGLLLPGDASQAITEPKARFAEQILKRAESFQLTLGGGRERRTHKVQGQCYVSPGHLPQQLRCSLNHQSSH